MSRKTTTLLLCCAAQFMVILDVSIVNVALPAIHSDLRFSATDLQWVVNAYALTFAGFLLLGGRATDLLGQRRVLVAGLALFGLASLAGGLAVSRGMLVGARAVQGLGGAVVAPSTLAVLSTTFAAGPERNRALSAWGAMGGAGGAAGALLGGILTEALSWRWTLFINLPLTLLAIALALRVVADVRRDDAAARHVDVAGALTVTAGLVVLVFGMVRSDTYGWGSARTIGTLLAGAALIGVFLLVEGRVARAPLVPLRFFRSRGVSGANVVVFALGSSAFAMWYFLSLYMQQVLGFSPVQTGLAFLPMTAAIIACSTVAGRLVGRFGPGPVLVAGMSLIAAGMALFTRIGAHGTWASDVLAPSLLVAAGIGLSFVPVTIAAVSEVAASESGLASGLVNTSRQVGGALGLALLATVAAQRTGHLSAVHETHAMALTGGYQRAFLVGACFAAAGALAGLGLVLLVPRRRRARAAAVATG